MRGSHASKSGALRPPGPVAAPLRYALLPAPSPREGPSADAARWLVPLVVAAMTAAWAGGFGYLSIVRHLAGGSSAEDLGFTDQVIANFLRGQWFRMSIYQGGATWNTELDVSRIARPDSLLAFHAEPMLLALVPLYALGGSATTLLAIQALAVAPGAMPAYRLGRYLADSQTVGLAVSAAYLLSPLGQWSVLSDFHTSTLAAPLLLLSVERLLVARNPTHALIAAGMAASAREDVGPVLVMLGLGVLLTHRQHTRAGALLAAMGLGWTALAFLVIGHYSGGSIPFDTRYAKTLGAGFETSLQALVRPTVLDYAQTLLLSGTWLGLIQPLFLLPALPSLAANALSSSPWMAAGKAHYSGLVLPFIVIGAALALSRLRRRPRIQTPAAAALVLSSVIGYVSAGSGPFAANYAPAVSSSHAAKAAAIVGAIPADESVSATAALVPRLSQRPRIYVFPAIEDADTVLVDLKASPAPTSAGDVYLRITSLINTGGWQVDAADDGLMLLRRAAVSNDSSPAATVTTEGAFDVSLVDAALVPSPTGAVGVDGPHWILRTTWRADHAIPTGTRLEFDIRLSSGEQLHVWDIADLWWNPPDHWPPGQSVTIEVPDIPVHQFSSWSAVWLMP